MEDAAIYAQAGWFQATARQRVAGLWIQTALRSSWDLPSAFRARIFICSTCHLHSTMGLSSAAVSWTARMYSLLPRKANSWAAPLPK